MKKIYLTLCVFFISVHVFAQKFPFEVSLENINENTKWYYIKINNNYIGLDDQQKLFVTSGLKDNKDKYLWAFIDAGKESFYLTNRYLGNSYRLDSYGNSPMIQNGELAVMKQGTGRKMHYKLTKKSGAGIYTKDKFDAYLGTDNSRVGFVTSAQKADIIVDFAKSESDIMEELKAEEYLKAEEQRKIKEQRKIEEQRKNEEIAKRRNEFKNRNGQWVNLTRDVEGYGYIKKIRVNTNNAAQSSSGCSVYLVTLCDNKPTYFVLNTNSWIAYFAGAEYKNLNTLPKKDGWVELNFLNFDDLYSLKSVDNLVPLEAIQFCEMNDDEVAAKTKPDEVTKFKEELKKLDAELKAQEKETARKMNELYKKYGKKFVDAADRGEIVVGMHEELVALMCRAYGMSMQLKYDNGQSKEYDIRAIRDVKTGYNQVTEKYVYVGSVWITNHKVSDVYYGDRWYR